MRQSIPIRDKHVGYGRGGWKQSHYQEHIFLIHWFIISPRNNTKTRLNSPVIKTINPTGAKSAQAKKKMTKQRRWFGRVFSMKVIQKLCRTLDTFVQYLFCQERGLFLHKEFAQSAPCATIFVQATSSEQRGYLWSEDQKLKKTNCWRQDQLSPTFAKAA